jgi:hypothetical protein
MQRYWLSKQMVHIVTARPWRVNLHLSCQLPNFNLLEWLKNTWITPLFRKQLKNNATKSRWKRCEPRNKSTDVQNYLLGCTAVQNNCWPTFQRYALPPSLTRQYIAEDNSELHTRRRENLKSHISTDGYPLVLGKKRRKLTVCHLYSATDKLCKFSRAWSTCAL